MTLQVGVNLEGTCDILSYFISAVINLPRTLVDVIPLRTTCLCHSPFSILHSPFSWSSALTCGRCNEPFRIGLNSKLLERGCFACLMQSSAQYTSTESTDSLKPPDSLCNAGINRWFHAKCLMCVSCVLQIVTSLSKTFINCINNIQRSDWSMQRFLPPVLSFDAQTLHTVAGCQCLQRKSNSVPIVQSRTQWKSCPSWSALSNSCNLEIQASEPATRSLLCNSLLAQVDAGRHITLSPECLQYMNHSCARQCSGTPRT